MQPLAYTTYTPLRFAPPSDFPSKYSAPWSAGSPQSHRHISPVSGSNAIAIDGVGSGRKRRMDFENASSHKRIKQEWLQAVEKRSEKALFQAESSCRHASSTQYNPVELRSGPEPMPTSPSKKLLVSSNSHSALSELEVHLERQPSKKYYAVAAGHVPGIYVDWLDAMKQLKGFSGNQSHSFKLFDGAWEYLQINTWIVRFAIENHRGPSKHEIRSRARSLIPAPLVPLPPSLRNGHRSALPPPKNYIPVPQPAPLPSHSLPPRDMQDPPPPYSLHTQPAQSLASSIVPQPHIHSAATIKLEPEHEPEPVRLSAEQQHVVDLIMQGHNVFYTGSAGCGKSTILKAFVPQLRAQGKLVRIVAPTNLAALNVNGQTTWNFAGWTPNSLKKSLAKLKEGACGKEVWKRFDTTDVLVIDEISMVENHIFERLNEILKLARKAKHGDAPFGGIQLIVTGDFCQLSPVKPFQYCIGCGWELKMITENGTKQYECENKRGCKELRFEEIDKWAFRSKAWQACNFQHINLREIHRQNDKKFISILQRIRTHGEILPHHGKILLNHTTETEGGVKLFARRDDVDRLNKKEIDRLQSKAFEYKCFDNFHCKEHHQDDVSVRRNGHKADDSTLAALREHRYEVSVTLKEGMRVVLQANLDAYAGLVNGSQGTIMGFEPYGPDKMPRKAENRSKTGSLNGPVLRGTHAGYAEHQLTSFAEKNHFEPWPIVRFDNGLEKTIFADCTVNELGNEEPYSLLSRSQIPLAAGYAITVHKSQGMTLDRVIVDLSRAFESSQIYVALSRARSLRGLKVEALPRDSLGGANAQVKEFFEKYLNKKPTTEFGALSEALDSNSSI